MCGLGLGFGVLDESGFGCESVPNPSRSKIRLAVEWTVSVVLCASPGLWPDRCWLASRASE